MTRKVTAIPATRNRFTETPLVSKEKRKVAGYARVSTDHEEQTSSYEAQMDYYRNYINSRSDWSSQECMRMRVSPGRAQKPEQDLRKWSRMRLPER